jgi:hypothetical protein
VLLLCAGRNNRHSGFGVQVNLIRFDMADLNRCDGEQHAVCQAKRQRAKADCKTRLRITLNRQDRPTKRPWDATDRPRRRCNRTRCRQILQADCAA